MLFHGGGRGRGRSIDQGPSSLVAFGHHLVVFGQFASNQVLPRKVAHGNIGEQHQLEAVFVPFALREPQAEEENDHLSHKRYRECHVEVVEMEPEQPAGQTLRFDAKSVVAEPHQVQNTPRKDHKQVQSVSCDFGMGEDDTIAEPCHFDGIDGVPEIVLSQRCSDCGFDKNKPSHGKKRYHMEEVGYASGQEPSSYEGKEDEEAPQTAEP